VVLSWLREYCPVDLEPEALADLLSVRGVHVEAVERPWGDLDGVVVARVLEVADHPSSEKLSVTRVTDGRTERQVLAGVRNMRAGDLVPLAPPGARVPGLPEPLEPRKLRGLVSDGMLCSPRELALSQDHGGILILPEDTPVGADLKVELGLDDVVFDIEIEPNRPDLMSVLGVAREAAAATGVGLRPPEPSLVEAEDRAADAASVEVRDRERCPWYLGRIIRDVSVGPSPLRIQARLTAAGMRPVSNVVDATNYAMLAVGQPMHPFDLDQVAGKGIVVRRAEEGERLVTLDDAERVLTAEDLVIADQERAVGIAGVMGSAVAEVHDGTRDILLESAYFEPKGVIRTSRRLALQTEASIRFGRGADPENPPRGAALAAELMAAWAGGTVLRGAAEAGGPPPRRRTALRASRATAVLGYPVSPDDSVQVFRRLGMVASADGDRIDVEVPGYRVDLADEIDLIEEVVRVQGYEGLSSTLPGIRQAGGVSRSYALRRRARQALAGAGLRESIALSFASPEDVVLMGHDPRTAVPVGNPVSAEQGYLRTSLVPALVRALQRNLSRGARSAALFEVGHVMRLGDPVDEREAAAGAMTGPRSTEALGDPGSFDFFDAKGSVEALLERLAVRSWSLGDPAGPPFHPARSAVIVVAGKLAGVVGELHPGVAASFDLRDRVGVFEVDLSMLGDHGDAAVRYREVSRFPAVHRDLAFVLPAEVPAARVAETLRGAAGALLDRSELFDVFVGPPVPEGARSLAFALEFRAPDRTLTDDEVEAAVARAVGAVATELGGVLRATQG
jgi:phenylalanyl-tRNA synthetase beta chain